MKKIIIAIVVVLAVIASFFLGFNLKNTKEILGTSFTMNTSNGSYTDSADFYQNVQAMAERMTGLSQYKVLQADSSGNMQAVAPSAVTLSGVTLTSPVLTEAYESLAVSNTISIAESNKTFYISGTSSIHTLPAPTAGAIYKFVVSDLIYGNTTIVTAGGSDLIQGTMIVAGAVVDCDLEDTITFVADGENVGDFITLRSNGTNWFIGESGALTASKMTCTAS